MLVFYGVIVMKLFVYQQNTLNLVPYKFTIGTMPIMRSIYHDYHIVFL